MKIRLTCLDAAVRQPPIVIRELPAVVGRSPAVDAPVNDCWVSRRHCELDESNGVLVVRDLHSSHGTLVNGEPVAEANLWPGDRLTVGLSSFRVHYRPGRALLQAACPAGVPTRS